ncbi:MAG TPA: malto-oligosyltrehalose synthase, partial [Gammaproteobacteria bacterium]
AYWLVATDQINYRRFFDINDLAGIRMDNPAVFATTHRLIRTLVADGAIDGLRVDHVDGLSDPYGYCRDLRRLMDGAQEESTAPASGFVLIEKILASYEHLPADWPVAGTTGYEAAHLLNGLFVHPGALRHMTRIYTRFTGDTEEFDEILYHCKHLIIHGALASELNVLANLAGTIAQADRHTRDFTYQRLRDALADIVASFPVYRTYITPQRIGEEDRRYLHWAISQAKKRSLAVNVQVFDFLQRLLSLDFPEQHDTEVHRLAVRLASRFQQYTAPVMAKGMEDTAFYVYNRLVSLNDVGFNPRIFGMSVNAFHLENRQRLEIRPDTLIATSTHDSKRGEDVRACIDVLSEIPHEWHHHLVRWSRFNLSKKRLVGDRRAPSRNDEYLLYQTLIGAWPLEQPDADGFAAFRERIETYMLKAIKEAKVHTSWINPDEEYETAMRSFVGALLDSNGRNPFLADFMPFQQRIARFGLLNGLAQTLLKLTMPGMPDIYQGNELWALNLADPDNRRPVDYARRKVLLDELRTSVRNRAQLPARVTHWVEHMEDGRIKLYVTWRALMLRREHPRLFGAGRYLGLEVTGTLAEHVCAFARRLDDQEIIVVTARWFARLAAGHERLPIGGAVWNDTRIRLPEAAPESETGSDGTRRYRNVLTEETVSTHAEEDTYFLDAAELFAHLPVALLVRADESSY